MKILKNLKLIDSSKVSFLILLIAVISIIPKWFLGIFYFKLDYQTNFIINFIDQQYLPIILSLADFNLKPTYLETISPNGVIGFPVISLLPHALFYKFFGINSLIFLNIIFRFILFYSFFLFVKKFLKNNFYLLSFIIFFVLFLGFVFFLNTISDNYIIYNLWLIIKNFFGYKVPRPTINSIFLFFTLYYLIKIYNFELKKRDYLPFSFSLAMTLNTFFYNFIVTSLVILLIFFSRHKQKILIFFFKNYKTNLRFLFYFFIFASIFFIQQIYVDPEYKKKIGLVILNYDQKIFFLKYYLLKVFFSKYSVIFWVSIFFLLVSNNFFPKNKINFLFLCFFASILAPIFFVIFSPGVIGLSHFLNQISFYFLLYLVVFIFIFLQKINFEIFCKKYFQITNNFVLFIFFLIFVFTVFLKDFRILKQNNLKNDLNLVSNFLDKNHFNGRNLKIFSNHYTTSNLWLLKRNNFLLVSDGWTNVISKKESEELLFNSLKSLGITSKQFKSYLKIGKVLKRDELIMHFSNYRYVANSLYQYGKLSDYSLDSRKMILKTSPFRNQNVIISETEKKYLFEKFNKITFNKNLAPDLVIIHKKSFSKIFNIRKSLYKNVLDLENYFVLIK